MGIVRTLEDVYRELILLSEQGKVQGFFNNVKNADKLVGLVEDTRDAMMDYQVCMSPLIPTTPNIGFRLRCNKIPTTRVAN